MAVRFADSIDNGNNSIKNTGKQRLKNAQDEANRILTKIYKYKEDMSDAIDTCKYVEQKGLERFIRRDPYDKNPIEFRNSFYFDNYPLCIYMYYKGRGADNVSILFDGENLYLAIVSRDGIRKIKVEDSIRRAYYKDEFAYFCGAVSADDWHTPIIIKALSEFLDNIKEFLDAFFQKVQNIR